MKQHVNSKETSMAICLSSSNLLTCDPDMIYYLKKLKTQHKTMTLYYLCTNEKIENLNEILSFMLTKYFMNKLT